MDNLHCIGNIREFRRGFVEEAARESEFPIEITDAVDDRYRLMPGYIGVMAVSNIASGKFWDALYAIETAAGITNKERFGEEENG